MWHMLWTKCDAFEENFKSNLLISLMSPDCIESFSVSLFNQAPFKSLKKKINYNKIFSELKGGIVQRTKDFHKIGLYGSMARRKIPWFDKPILASILASLEKTITVKHGGGSIMWECSSTAGSGKLVRIWWQDYGAKYRAILDENLFWSARDLTLGWRFPYQKDPKYTGKTTFE